MNFRKFIASLLVAAVLTSSAFAGKDGTWSGSTTHQFFPTIIQTFLGNGYALVPTQALFGDCSDGNVTISSGTTTLTRDMYYNNLTLSGTGVLSIQNQRVFVCGTLDLTAAAAGAITGSGNNGGAGGAAGAAGSAGTTTAAGTNVAGKAGTAGGASSTTTGAAASSAAGGNNLSNSAGGSSGAGGTGASGANAAGVGRAANAGTNYPMRDILHWYLPITGAGGAIFAGISASGGGGGGGDGTSSGAGGGGGGASGNTIYLSVNILKTGVSTLAGTIVSNGGNGGNGGTPSATCTLGCGGGGGGGGGWIVFKYNTKVGSTVTNLVQALGGTGGAAGSGKNAGGLAGTVGNVTPSVAGLIQILNLATGAPSSITTGSASL